MINNRGFSYIQLLLASALMGLMAIQIAKMGQQRADINRVDRLSQALTTVVDHVSNMLSHEEICTASLKDKTFEAGKDFTIKNVGGEDVFFPNKNLEPGVNIDYLQFGTSEMVDTDLYIGKVKLGLKYKNRETRRGRELGITFSTKAGVIDKCATGENAILSLKKALETPPPVELRFASYEGNTYWKCGTLDLKAAGCSGPTGCTISVYLQKKSDNDRVLFHSAKIFMEQPETTNNTGVGIYGWTQKYGGGKESWILGNNQRYDIYDPWDYVIIDNYVRSSCTFGPDDETREGTRGEPMTGSDIYKVNVAIHPSFKARVIVQSNSLPDAP